MTHVYLGRVRSWIRLRTAKPQPPCQGPVSTSTAAQQSAQADSYNDIIRQRNTLLIQMTSAVSSVHLGGLTDGEEQDWS